MKFHNSHLNVFPRFLRLLCQTLILIFFIFYTVLPGAILPAVVIAESGFGVQLSGTLFVIPGGATSGACTHWDTACDLQYALTNAVAPAELWVKMGSYTPTNGTDRTISFQLKSGVALYGGFLGDEADRNQRNPAANPTILSGEIGGPSNLDNTYHVVNGSGTDSTAMLDGFTISGGHATTAGPDRSGGGMVINSGSPMLSNVTFRGNTASTNGGGLYNSSGSPTLTNVAFINNSVSNNGGGIYCQLGSLKLTNVTFSGNTSYHGGGEGSFTCNLMLNNVTISDNTANLGGGIYNQESSSLIMTNGILWDNAPDQIDNDATSSATLSYSDVKGGYPGDDNLDADPLLGILDYYTGATPVFPLLPGSAAIDTGDNGSCAATDQRGISRPQLAQCDIGAYESRGFSLVISIGNNQNAEVNTAFAQPLSLSVNSTYAEPVNGGFLTFTPPNSGASADLVGNPALIANGSAQVSATANSEVGNYQVLANAKGVTTPVNFHLTNFMGAFGKLLPVVGAVEQPLTLTLSWESSLAATGYVYCIDTTDNNACDGDAWHSTGSNLSVEINSLAPNTHYYWQTRAVAGSLFLDADAGAWWHFTTESPFILFLPVVRK